MKKKRLFFKRISQLFFTDLCRAVLLCMYIEHVCFYNFDNDSNDVIVAQVQGRGAYITRNENTLQL